MMWKRFRLELSFAVLAAFCVWAWQAGHLLTCLLVGLAAIVAGGVVLVRWGRVALHKLIWHLRDRLIVAYLFIAVIPIAVIVVAARWVAVDLGGQIAVYLVNTELDRRVLRLGEAAKAIAETPSGQRSMALEERFPGAGVQLLESSPGDDPGPSGILVRDGLLYVGAHAVHRDSAVALLAPLSRPVLASLVPGLGPVSIIGRASDSPLHLHEAADGDAVTPVELPPPGNRFDIELRWASQIRVADARDPARSHEALLGVRSRLSALLHTLFAEASNGQEEADLRNDMMLAGMLLLLAQVISVYIGVSVTQAITGAFNGLYEGTQRVMRGDFSHRIAVKGDDQIAEVTTSFNRMTGNIERLLEVAKEKERFEAELAIARRVQEELFPRSVPELDDARVARGLPSGAHGVRRLLRLPTAGRLQNRARTRRRGGQGRFGRPVDGLAPGLHPDAGERSAERSRA